MIYAENNLLQEQTSMNRIFFYLFCILSFSSMHAFECDNNYELAELEEENIEDEDEIDDEEINEDEAFSKSISVNDVPDSNNAMATIEAGPSAIVAGCVNAITGDFFESHVSVNLPGAQPLTVQCFYCSSEKKWNFQHMANLDVGSSGGGNHLSVRYFDDNGSGITYRAYFSKTKVRGKLNIPSRLFEKGLTNCGTGVISGKTNWRNSYFSIIRRNDDKSYMLTHGSGINRIFVTHKKVDEEGKTTEKKFKKAPIGQFYLKSEHHPNGNCLHYRYEDDKLKRVKAVNQANQLLARLSITRDKHLKRKVNWISDSGYVTFKFYDKEEELIIK